MEKVVGLQLAIWGLDEANLGSGCPCWKLEWVVKCVLSLHEVVAVVAVVKAPVTCKSSLGSGHETVGWRGVVPDSPADDGDVLLGS